MLLLYWIIKGLIMKYVSKVGGEPTAKGNYLLTENFAQKWPWAHQVFCEGILSYPV